MKPHIVSFRDDGERSAREKKKGSSVGDYIPWMLEEVGKQTVLKITGALLKQIFDDSVGVENTPVGD
jgi:hypothetical protein